MMLIEISYLHNILLFDMTIRMSPLRIGVYHYPLIKSFSLSSSSLEQILLLFFTVCQDPSKQDWMLAH